MKNPSNLSRSLVICVMLIIGGLPGISVANASQTAGTITRYAGGASGQVLDTDLFDTPGQLQVDHGGAIYIADTDNNRIRKASASDQKVVTIAGNGLAGFSGDGADPRMARFNRPMGVAVSPTGTVFVADTYNHRIRKFADFSATVTTVAGNGVAGFSGDGGLGTSASLNHPGALALDAAGNLFIADQGNDRVRRLDAVTGIITTIGGAANIEPWRWPSTYEPTSQVLESPGGLAFNSYGDLLISDTGNDRILIVLAGTGGLANQGETIYIIAGGGCGATICPSYDPYYADLTTISQPMGLATFGDDVYFAERGNSVIRRLYHQDGMSLISTVAGVHGVSGNSADGQSGKATVIRRPEGIAIDNTSGTNRGALYLTHQGDGSTVGVVQDLDRVRKVSPGQDGAVKGDLDEIVSTKSGAGNIVGCCADDYRPATMAVLANPSALELASDTSLYLADSSNNRVIRVWPDGELAKTVAGNGIASFSGEGGPAKEASLNGPSGVVLDSQGNLLISDTGNNRIRRVTPGADGVVDGDPDEVITTIAGTALEGFAGDGGAATSARLFRPGGLDIDSLGRVLIADRRNYRVRRLIPGVDGLVDGDTDDTIITIAGNGQACQTPTCGDGGFATLANLVEPRGVTVFGEHIYIADGGNNRVRWIDPQNVNIQTVAGTGLAASAGDGLSATQASVQNPWAVIVDPTGNLYIADTDGQRIRRVVPGADGVVNAGPGEVISTIAGTGSYICLTTCGDGGPATQATLYNPSGLALQGDGSLYLSDRTRGTIRKVWGPIP